MAAAAPGSASANSRGGSGGEHRDLDPRTALRARFVAVTSSRRSPGAHGRRFLVAAAAALALGLPAVAAGGVSIRPAAELPVELLRPAPDEVLVSGRESTIAWRALRDLGAEGVHEWEAFLSFDGGRSWPVRATPHLDISVSSFRFAIPLVPSDDVRIMLRFGDERREVGYILPMVLSSKLPARTWTAPSEPEPVLGPGEAARPGVPGVVLWVEGERDGRQVVTRTTSWRPATAVSSAATGSPPPSVVVRPDERARVFADSVRPPVETGPDNRDGLPARGVLPFLSLLLLLCRRNE